VPSTVGIVASGYLTRPDDLPGLQLWLDAADASTITESGGAVSQWDDKSGNGRNFTQGTGANQPTTGTRTQNSLNVFDFDGSDALVGPTTPNLDAAPVELFVACDVDGIGTFFSQTDKENGALRQLQVFRTTNALAPSVGSYVLGQNTPITRNPQTGRFRVAGINWISSGSVLRDGNTTTALSVGSATESGVPWRVGARGPGLSFSLDGTVGEVLLFLRELTADERTGVLTYLADKWDITL